MWFWKIILVILSMCLNQAKAETSLVPCNETVTHNSYVVSNSSDSVEYNCFTDYIQTGGNRQLNCTADGFWNDTELICELPCNKTVTHNSLVISLNSESVIYACEFGFHQVAGSSHLNCTEDGFWNGTVPTCLPINCGTPSIGDNVQTDFSLGTTSTLYMEEIAFVCDEGYQKKGIYWGTYECSNNQQWTLKSTKYSGDIICNSDASYMGCYASEDFIVTSEIPQSAHCRSNCIKENARFVGLSADMCFCGNTLNGTAIGDKSSCNTTCPSKDKNSPYYCGGPNGLLSVYLTRQMAEIVSMSGSPPSSLSVKVYGDQELACKQLCATEHAYYAVLTEQAECLCTNTTYIKGIVSNSTDQPDVNSTMFNLAKYNSRAADCSELYSKNVRNNGWYFLLNKENPEYCSFADGTPCEDGWVGFAGSCYWFETSQMDFNDSLAHCLSINSSLASLDTQDVITFVRDFIGDFEPDFRLSKWRFGATDFHLTSSFTWLDGNLSTKSFYKANYPISDSSDCLYLSGATWVDNVCTFPSPFICRKDPEMFKCVEFDIDDSPDVGKFVYSNEKMYRQLCIQACDGHLSVNALLQGINCICTNISVESRVTVLPESACASRCPGNAHQICGGDGSKMYSYKRSLNLSRASNCQDLENQGLGNITVMLSGTTEPTLCPLPECPFSWVKRPGYSSCYKFAFTTKHPSGALSYCSIHNAHLVTFDDPEELQYLKNLSNGVESFPPVLNSWIVGYRATQKGSTFIRGATGKRLGNITIVESSTYRHVYLEPSSFTLTRHAFLTRNFICEKSPEYLGSYLIDSNEEIILGSPDMTIQLCVETCRVNNKMYALLSETQCRCQESPPDSSNITTSSLMECRNSDLQVCGKSSYSASFYKTDEYPLYESCQALYENGIRQHGLYQLTSGLQYCQFYDNSTVCEQDWVAWNGTCFTVIKTPSSGYGYEPIQEWRSSCGQKGGRLVTIDSLEKHQFIAELLMGSERLIVPTVLLGYSESVLLGAPTWASGSLSEYMQDTSQSGNYVPERVLIQDHQYLNTQMSVSSDSPPAEAAVCETEKDFIGVFKQPLSTEPVIRGYGLMTLTQCKQACMGGEYDLAMVGRDSCWCGAMTDVNSLVSDSIAEGERLNATSETYCLGNNIQRCPRSGNVDVYLLDEHNLDFPASSCNHLYSNGVFFDTTYKIINESGSSKQTCGFAENSNCRSDRMFWGYKDGCYKFSPVITSGYLNAAQCFLDDSLPYLPTQDDQLIPVLKEMIPAFKENTSVFIGVSVRSKNCHSLSSEGFFVRSCPVVTSDDVNGYKTLNLSSMTWEEVSGNHYGICKSPQNESIRCIDIDSLSGSLILDQEDIYPLTTSVCIQLCLGQDSNFSVVLERGCMCYGDDVNYLNKLGKCTACSGHETQMCGNDLEKSGVLVNLDFYRDDIARSCEELFSYGINVPGEYYIMQHNRRFRVTCFKRDSSVSAITSYTVTPSSLDAGLSNQGFQIHAFTNWSTDNAWRPETSDIKPSLHFTFSEDYILTAIQTQGDVLSESWVETYQLTSKLGNEETEYVTINGSTNIAGNTDRYGRVTHFLPNPKITRELRLFPVSSHGNISLRVTLFGEPMTEFNHSVRYLGCFLDAAEDFIYKSLFNSENACKTECQTSYQFYSVYTDQDGRLHCYCGNSLYTYGTLEVAHCVPSQNNTVLPVYRAYDTYCDNRTEHHASLLISLPFYPGDFLTLGSMLYYWCDEGFILSDSTKVKSVTCSESEGTYFWEDTYGSCKVINCSSLSGQDTWYDLSTDNVTYGTIVTVTCNNSLYMANGKSSKTLSCLDSTQWNDTVTPCIHPFCPSLPPSIRNGMYEINDDGTNAKYSCQEFYQLTTNTHEETISCLGSQQWQTLNFTCEINDTNVRFRQGEFDLIGLFERQQDGGEVIGSYISTSLFTCTDRCLKNTKCIAYSYNNQGRNCLLFNNRAQNNQLEQNSVWKYFELNVLLME